MTRVVGEVLYDVTVSGRYASTADMILEARLLGLDPDDTFQALADELDRCGLTSNLVGRAVRTAKPVKA